jgi:hypothetical protein
VIRPAPAAAVPLVLVPALGLTQGGFSPDEWVWAGALAAWATALAVVLSDDAGALRRAWPWLAFGGGLLAWTLASSTWSVHATQSVLDARRTLVYAAVLLALVVLARGGAGGSIVLATFAAITAVVVYALTRYLLGTHHLVEFEGYLLSDPLGYANAMGILAALGILLGLGLGSRAGSHRARAVAAAPLPLLALAVELSGSGASWLALAVGFVAGLLLEDAPLRLVRIAVAVAVPSVLLVVLGRLSEFNELAEPRIGGRLLAVAAVACTLASAAIAGRFGRATPDARRLPAWALVSATVICVGLAVALVRSVGTEPRASYYRVAWHEQYAHHPLLGSGAGTFAYYWARSGHVASRGGALDAHSLYLEALAELGPLGLALLLATLLYPLKAAVKGRHVPYVPAAGAAYVAFLLHAGLDWDWEMPVVVVAALSCAAAIVSSGVARERPLGVPARAAVLVAALVLGACAIAGARSHTQPGATKMPHGAWTARAPR